MSKVGFGREKSVSPYGTYPICTLVWQNELQGGKLRSLDVNSFYFSKSLSSYFCKRASGPFLMGEWISSLDNDSLVRLLTLVEGVDASMLSGSLNQDILQCALSGYAAEQGGSSELSIDQVTEVLGVFCVLALLEAYKRDGWIEILETLSINPKSTVGIRITESGWKNKDQMSKFWH